MKPFYILKLFIKSLQKYSLRLNFAHFFIFLILSMGNDQVISSEAGTQASWGCNHS